MKSLIAVLVLSSAAIAQAPYGNPGTPAPESTYTANTTGDLTGAFVSSSAGGTDLVRVFDVTSGYVSPFGLNNQTSAPGQSFDFGHVSAEDELVFEIENLGPGIPPGNFLGASQAIFSSDGINHVFGQSFNGGAFLGFEDLPFELNDFGQQVTDLDYNDVLISINDVTVTPTQTPEPSTFALLGTGILAAAGTLRRRLIG